MSAFTPSQPFIIQPEQGPPLPSQTMGMPGPLPVARIARPRGGGNIGAAVSNAVGTGLGAYLDFIRLRQQSDQYQQSLAQRRFEDRANREERERVQLTNAAAAAIEAERFYGLVEIQMRLKQFEDLKLETIATQDRMLRHTDTLIAMAEAKENKFFDAVSKFAEQKAVERKAARYGDDVTALGEIVSQELRPANVKDMEAKTALGMDMAEVGEGAFMPAFLNSVNPMTYKGGTPEEFIDRFTGHLEAKGGAAPWAKLGGFLKLDSTQLAMEGKTFSDMGVDAEIGVPFHKAMEAYGPVSVMMGLTLDDLNAPGFYGKGDEKTLLPINQRVRDVLGVQLEDMMAELKDPAAIQFDRAFPSGVNRLDALDDQTASLDLINKVGNEIGFLHGSVVEPSSKQQILETGAKTALGIGASIEGAIGLVSDRAAERARGSVLSPKGRGLLGLSVGHVKLQAQGHPWDQPVIGGESNSPELRAFLELKAKWLGLNSLDEKDLVNGVGGPVGQFSAPRDRLKKIGWDHLQNMIPESVAPVNMIFSRSFNIPGVQDALGGELIRDKISDPAFLRANERLKDTDVDRGMIGNFLSMTAFAHVYQLAQSGAANDPSTNWRVKWLEEGNPAYYANFITMTNEQLGPEYGPRAREILAMPEGLERAELSNDLIHEMRTRSLMDGLTTVTNDKHREILNNAIATGGSLPPAYTRSVYFSPSTTLAGVAPKKSLAAGARDTLFRIVESGKAKVTDLQRKTRQGLPAIVGEDIPDIEMIPQEVRDTLTPAQVAMLEAIHHTGNRGRRKMFPPPDEAPAPQPPGPVLPAEGGGAVSPAPTGGPSAGGAPLAGAEGAAGSPVATPGLDQGPMGPPLPLLPNQQDQEPLQVQSVLGQ